MQTLHIAWLTTFTQDLYLELSRLNHAVNVLTQHSQTASPKPLPKEKGRVLSDPRIHDHVLSTLRCQNIILKAQVWCCCARRGIAAVDIYDSSEIYIMFFFSHFSMSFPQYIYIFSTMQLTHSMAQLTYEQYMRRANIEQLQKLSQSVQSRPISDSPRGDVVCHNSVIHPSLISLVSYAKRPVNLRVSAPIPCYKARG